MILGRLMFPLPHNSAYRNTRVWTHLQGRISTLKLPFPKIYHMNSSSIGIGLLKNTMKFGIILGIHFWFGPWTILFVLLI